MAPKKAPAWNAEVMSLDTVFAMSGVTLKSRTNAARAIVVPMKAES